MGRAEIEPATLGLVSSPCARTEQSRQQRSSARTSAVPGAVLRFAWRGNARRTPVSIRFKTRLAIVTHGCSKNSAIPLTEPKAS